MCALNASVETTASYRRFPFQADDNFSTRSDLRPCVFAPLNRRHRLTTLGADISVDLTEMSAP
jgi:hypothetical protein